MSYRLTDNPAAPCSYCVDWRGPNGEDVTYTNADEAVPWMPSGPVDRIYRNTHRRCAESVALYEAEHEGDPA